jgi:protein-S-isoprenylcysteine O-methyltransferase Ste14
VVAGLVPWLLTGWDGDAWLPLQIAGGVVVALGAGVLLHAFARFVIEGRGTPAPVAPTQRLVVGGLYRYVRNPMYLAVLATIVGQALLFGQAVLIAYAAVVAAAFVAFVRWYEEPTLARQFRADYDAYRRAVPGWWPRLPRGG